MARDDCLTDDDIAAFVTAALGREGQRRVEAHIDECPKCFALLGEFGRVFTSVNALALASRSASLDEARADSGLRSLAALLQSALQGETIGPYLVRDIVGWGGAGVVFAGWDERLDRPVALKILASEGVPAAAAKAEAQVVARLDHPNVVEVYDVLEEHGRVVIVMELVGRGTLRTWQQAADRQQIVEMYGAAAEGLAAAHAGGLVHRDFKPDNVLVGSDGRPRVSDFGLAATIEVSSAAADGHVNRGAVGTPSYMAPEQRAGRPVDGRADQYSFCVALAEALTGSTKPAALDSLPRRLAATLRRGMAEEPAARWPSMPSLGAALRQRRAWRLPAAAAGTVLVALSGLAVVVTNRPNDGCALADSAAREIWTQQRRRALKHHFAAADESLGPSTWAKVDPALERWFRDWSEQRVSACLAANAQDGAAAQQPRIECLRESLGEATVWLETLASANKQGILRAVEGTAALRVATACSPSQARPEARPPPRLARAIAERRIGNYAAAESLAAALLLEVPVDQDRVLAMVRYELAASAAKAGHSNQARDAYTEAYWNAASVDDTRLMVRTAAGLAHHLAARVGEPDLAEPWIEHARAAAAREGADDALRADVAAAEASLFTVRGDHAAARDALTVAIDLRTRASEPPIAIARLEANRVVALKRDGALKTAEVQGRKALARLESILGRDHPMVASSANTVATVLSGMQRYDEALEHHRRALAIREKALGPDHPDTASVVGNIALIHKERGDHAEAIVWYTRALATMRRNPNVAPANLAITLSNLAGAHVASNQHAAALPLVDEALELLTGVLGSDHPTVAKIGANAASLHSRVGDMAWADAQFPRSLESLEAKAGPQHPALVGPLTNYAEHHLRAERPDDASALLRRARSLVESAPEHFGVNSLGTILFAQARALAGDPARAAAADALGRQALLLYAGAPHVHGSEITEIAVWLASREKK